MQLRPSVGPYGQKEGTAVGTRFRDLGPVTKLAVIIAAPAANFTRTDDRAGEVGAGGNAPSARENLIARV